MPESLAESAGRRRRRPDRDHPERLREGARHHQRLGPGEEAGDRRARAGRSTGPSRRRRERPGVAPGGSARKAERIGSGFSSPPSSPGPAAATARASSSSPRSRAAARRRGRPEGAEAAIGAARWVRGVDERPGGEQRSSPLETISLPTKTTSGSRPASPGPNSSTSTPGGPRRVLSLRSGRSGRADQGIRRWGGADQDALGGLHPCRRRGGSVGGFDR